MVSRRFSESLHPPQAMVALNLCPFKWLYQLCCGKKTATGQAVDDDALNIDVQITRWTPHLQ